MSLRFSLKVHGDFADGVKSEAKNRVTRIRCIFSVCDPLPVIVNRDRIDDEKSCEKTGAPRRLDEHSKRQVTYDEQSKGLYPCLIRLFLNKIAFVHENNHNSHGSQLDMKDYTGENGPFVGKSHCDRAKDTGWKPHQCYLSVQIARPDTFGANRYQDIEDGE